MSSMRVWVLPVCRSQYLHRHVPVIISKELLPLAAHG